MEEWRIESRNPADEKGNYREKEKKLITEEEEAKIVIEVLISNEFLQPFVFK